MKKIDGRNRVRLFYYCASQYIGVNLILTAFLHFQAEVEYFGHRVLPVVRALKQRGDLAEAA